MSKKIHHTAIISDGATLDGNHIEIGPYSIIGPNVVIGDYSKIHSHCVIEGDTVIGKSNQFSPFSAIGSTPQHSKFTGGSSKLTIGDNNIFREHVTVHPGTEIGSSITNKEYSNLKFLSPFFYLSRFYLLNFLKRQSKKDTNSEELLCFGYNLIIKKI